MKTRFCAGLAAAALALTPALVATPAQATPDQAESATSWLADQLPDDSIMKNYGYPDFGLTIDLALAFQATDTEPAATNEILDALAGPKTFTSYTTGDDFIDETEYSEIEDSQYAGATAKLATVVQQSDRDARNFGGHDLIAETEEVVVDDGDSLGRASDVSAFGDNSNTLGQSFVVRALSVAGSDEAAAAADYLVKQQCASGVFSISMSDAGCGANGTDSVDATAFAVEALLVARKNGYAGGAEAVDAAVDHLVEIQATDGSFEDRGTPNTNSTGLAAWALDQAGETEAATRAANWVLRQQTVELTPGLGSEVGAIAYDPAALKLGQQQGITDASRDQWVRATAQAVLVLSLGSEAEVTTVAKPQASVKNPKQGDTITVTVGGVDQFARPTGDVTDEVTLTSSVASDTIVGNKVTFNHASPHVITATHVPTGATSELTVEVTPLAVEDPDDGTDDGSDDGAGEGTGAGDSTGSADAGDDATAAPVGADLPGAGGTLETWQLLLAGGLVVAGAALVLGARRRRTVEAE